MSDDLLGTEGSGDGRKAYSVNIQVKAQSSTSCSFCWFVISLYPTLSSMTLRDDTTYREHLKKAHGLKEEIKP